MTNKKKTPSSVFLTVGDLVARWQCSENVVRAMLAKGDVPVYRFGRAVRVRLADVEVYEAEQVSGSHP